MIESSRFRAKRENFQVSIASNGGGFRGDMEIISLKAGLSEFLQVGQQVPLQNVTSGEMVYFTVVEIADTEVTLDANHPLAGQNLTFDIELVAIEPGGGD